jgi:type IV pilus biogenesis protein PilP
MMRKRTSIAALTLVVATAMPCLGADDETGTLADRLNRMDAQVQLLRKKLELDQALSLTAGTSLGSLPRVVAVYGFAQDLQVRLMLPSGMVSTYREGDVIRGSMKVVAITPKSVMVSVQAGRRLNAMPLEFIAGVRDGPGGATPLPPGMPATGPLPPELLPPPPVVGSPLPARARPPIGPDTSPAGAASAAGAPVSATVNNPAPRAR